jgi:hypothetical protein
VTGPYQGFMRVKVAAADAPDGRTMVLLQLPDGYVLTEPADARLLAAALVDMADKIDRARGDDQ